MVYRKKRTGRKRSRRMTKKTVARTVKRIITSNVEKKYIDVAPLNGNFNNVNWNITSLFSPSQGSAVGERVGDKCKYNKFSLRMVVQGTITASVRIMLIRWKPNNSTLSPITSVTRIFETAVNNGTAWKGEFNPVYRNQFVVYMDKTFVINPHSALLAFNKLIIKKRKVKGTLTYDAGGASTGTNQLYMIFMSDVSTNIAVSSHMRIWFTDA